MATKTELEQKVIELEAALAAAPDAVTKLPLLEQEVEALKSEKNTLAAELETSKSEKDRFSSRVDELVADMDKLMKLPSIAEDELVILKTLTIPELQKKIANLSADVVAAQHDSANCTISDHTVLDGVRYKNVHRNTVKELSIDLLKRYVAEDLTAVVIDKVGG